jgi:adenylosuccinate lyase
LLINVARGLVVYPSTIQSAVIAELPFMATEEILMAAVRAGGDRQQLHELIRRHSQLAAEQVKSHGRPNDLIHRLQQDPAFGKLNITQLLDPAHFIGRSPQQTEHFIISVIEPIRQRYRSQLGQNITLSV